MAVTERSGVKDPQGWRSEHVWHDKRSQRAEYSLSPRRSFCFCCRWDRTAGSGQGRDAGSQSMRSEDGEIVVEVVPVGDHDGDRDPAFTAAPLQPMGGALAFRIVVAGDEEPRYAGRRREGAEASGRERGGGDGVWQRRNQGEHGFDALADKERAGEGSTETDGTAVDVAERLARARDGRLWRPEAGRARCGGRRRWRRRRR